MNKLVDQLQKDTERLRDAGLWCEEATLGAPAGPTLSPAGSRSLNLASNDYLGFANRAAIKNAVKIAVEHWGVGLGTMRMVGGTQEIHNELEAALAAFVGTEAALLMPSGLHANLGLFEPLFDDRDCIFCARSSHPSLADGIRLTNAAVTPFDTDDLPRLEDGLQRSRSARYRVVVTDGVDALSGAIAPLPRLCELARTHDAMLVVDDSHGLGVLGPKGEGSAAHCGVTGMVDLVTSSLSHALGSGGGGMVAGRKTIVNWLRQRSRSYLTSEPPSPPAVSAALQALATLGKEATHLERLRRNATIFRDGLSEAGFRVLEGEHPIIAVQLGDLASAQKMADRLLKAGVYAVGFGFPVLPEGEARIRVQVSAGHTHTNLSQAVKTFVEVGKQVHVL